MAKLSGQSGVDTTAYESYDGGDPANGAHSAGQAVSWHRRISSETWLWFIVVGALSGLWLIAGSFRKILS